jgi:hypothetical protein
MDHGTTGAPDTDTHDRYPGWTWMPPMGSAHPCRTSTSHFVRVPLQLDTDLAIRYADLCMLHDDGFAAYVNGVEVAHLTQ